MKIEDVIMKIAKDWQIYLVIALLILTFFAIHPNFDREGVKITYVSGEVSKYLSKNAIIVEINGEKVKDVYDFNKIVSNITPGDVVKVKYKVQIFPYIFKTYESEAFVAPNLTNLGIEVEDIKATNLNFGIDLEGGVRCFLKPERRIDREEAEVILGIIERRLNIYGLKEVSISYFEDFSGNQYFKIEVSGMSKKEIEDLLGKKGLLEARIGNYTVFTGDDILQICPTLKQGSSCGIYPVKSNNQVYWKFYLGLQISEEAAIRFRDAIENLSIAFCKENDCYLNETLDFYLDGKLLENSSLLISSNLKGQIVTTPSITGARSTKEEAYKEMNKLKAILQSKQLPVKLEIARFEEISPRFRKFVKNLFILFAIAILAVETLVTLKYRKAKIIAAIVFATFSELIISLGISVMLKVTLDIGAIAGLIASVATGIDDQILMTEEAIGKKKKEELSIKEKLKKAMEIIITDFFTTLAALFPLLFASAGLLRGFAIMEILNGFVGTFVTRPAYSKLLEKIL